jgi:amino acid transporter
VATIAFILVYLAILVAAPLYLRRRKELTGWHLVSAAVGILFLVNGLAGNFYPAPDPPLNWLAYLAVGLVVAGAAWYLLLRRLSSRIATNIAEDLASIKQRFQAELEEGE